MEIILFVVSVISIVVAYIVGRVQGIPDYFPCQYDCRSSYSMCHCPKCCPWDYVDKTLAKINEQSAYNKGKFDGIQELRSDMRYTRFMSLSEQEKFLSRFIEATKPLEEMKKDLETGKF